MDDTKIGTKISELYANFSARLFSFEDTKINTPQPQKQPPECYPFWNVLFWNKAQAKVPIELFWVMKPPSEWQPIIELIEPKIRRLALSDYVAAVKNKHWAMEHS